MKREIKFRGKDATGRKGWVYGDLVHNQRVTETGTEPRVMVGGYEVIPETVGQFTGLYDRNGKEVYEGDIIAHYNDTSVVHRIIYSEKDAAFKAQWLPMHDEVGLTAAWMEEKIVFAGVYGGDIPCQPFCATEGNEYLEEKIRIFAEDCEKTGVEWSSDLDYIARHFFELGFNAKEAITLMTARLLGLQAEVYYLQMFDTQNEKPKILDAFLDKVASLPKTNIGAKVAAQLKKRGFALSAKQAYHISKTAIRHKIELR